MLPLPVTELALCCLLDRLLVFFFFQKQEELGIGKNYPRQNKT
jgi:hypothetical protein